MSNIVPMVGRSFGRWTIIRRSDEYNWINTIRYVCRCSCGTITTVDGASLRSGKSKSCGCLMREIVRTRVTTHNKNRTAIYNTWCRMIQRCTNKNNPDYKHYGARGITICNEWRTFEGFFRDMGDVPSGKSLERIDNDKGYSRENCAWISHHSQQLNKRNTRILVHNGETKSIVEWGYSTGLGAATIRYRIKRGWTVRDALTVPYGKRKKK